MCYCRGAFPNTRFVFGSHLVHIHLLPGAHFLLALLFAESIHLGSAFHPSRDSDMDIDNDSTGPRAAFSCLCDDHSAPGCSSTSTTVHVNVPSPPVPLLNILRDIFTAHYATHSRTYVFHSHLPIISTALALHTISIMR
ncbi:hypothetical protein B0H19DRAFT_1173209 [Mycena capillaripes]|nr:hypothetical protein B0H19DRAFT_1173209 [Mycena capillaripes]